MLVLVVVEVAGNPGERTCTMEIPTTTTEWKRSFPSPNRRAASSRERDSYVVGDETFDGELLRRPRNLGEVPMASMELVVLVVVPLVEIEGESSVCASARFGSTEWTRGKKTGENQKGEKNGAKNGKK